MEYGYVVLAIIALLWVWWVFAAGERVLRDELLTCQSMLQAVQQDKLDSRASAVIMTSLTGSSLVGDTMAYNRIRFLEAELRKVRENPEAITMENMKRLIWREPVVALVLYGGSGVFDCLYEEALIGLSKRIERLGSLPLRPRHQKSIKKVAAKYDQLVMAAVAAGSAYLVMDVADVK